MLIDPRTLLAKKMAALGSHGMALFLDYDGSTANINPVPQAVRVPPEFQSTVYTLHEQLGGALAFVTGRDLLYMDTLAFPHRKLPLSVGHGSHIRYANEPAKEIARPIDGTLIDSISPAHTSHLLTLEVETKPFGARALHFRQEPASGPYVLEAAKAIVREYNERKKEGPDAMIHAGKHVYEIASIEASKGHAIGLFLAHPTFASRTPVYFGDQPADESAMEVVNAHNGIAVGVGVDAPSIAQFRIARPADCHMILGAVAKAFVLRLGYQQAKPT